MSIIVNITEGGLRWILKAYLRGNRCGIRREVFGQILEETHWAFMGSVIVLYIDVFLKIVWRAPRVRINQISSSVLKKT